MNPYASHLGEDHALDVIARTPLELQTVLQSTTAAAWDEPLAPGKWSRKQVMCHLADTEIAFSFRLRQVLAEPHHVIQPFDQDHWAAHYEAYDGPAALQLFAVLRQWNLALLRAVPPQDFERVVMHPERGEMTFRTIVETMAGHDRNHLAQLSR